MQGRGGFGGGGGGGGGGVARFHLARQQPMLKLEVEYYLQLEDVKQYYFVHDGTKHHCKLISKNQAN